MSLKLATLKTSATGPPGAQTEQRPRFLSQPDSFPDSEEIAHHDKHNPGIESPKHKAKVESHPSPQHASSTLKKPFGRSHGNCKPGETPYHRRWVLPGSGGKQHMVQHPHAKTWCSSSCPGKRESAEGLNVFH